MIKWSNENEPTTTMCNNIDASEDIMLRKGNQTQKNSIV